MKPKKAVDEALHTVVRGGEGLWSQLRPRSDRPPMLQPYKGYATPDELVVRGRVLTSVRRIEPDATASTWANARQMVKLFLTDEVADVVVRSGDHTTRSDEEGYFTLRLPRPERGSGADVSGSWATVPLMIDGQPETCREARVLMPDADAQLAVISDIDDTVMKTGAWSKWRMYRTSLTGNAATREVFDDAVELLHALADGGRNPVFYVSSSAWNLHDFLDAVFRHNDVPEGPIFLRDLGLDDDDEGISHHAVHKLAAIDRIARALPQAQLVMMGDTGQHDAMVYADAIERWPGRVRAVILRMPREKLRGPAREGLARLEELPVDLFVARDVRAALDARAELTGR